MSMQLELKFDSDLHTKLRQAVRDRYQMSYNKMSCYYETWKDSEERFIAYLPTKEGDLLRKQRRKDGTPQFTTLQVPYSYAMLLTAQTYWTTVFLSRDPVFQYSARHGAPEMQVQAIEALLSYQTLVGEQLVPLYIWLLDKAKYGLGIVCNYWEIEQSIVSSIEEAPDTYLGLPLPGKTKKIRRSKRIRGYAGNKLFNVRPYDWYPDPRVPVKDFQRGEFCARAVELSWSDLVKGEEDGRYMNVEVLRKRKYMRQRDEQQGTGQVEYPEKNITADAMDIGYTTGVEMVIQLIPKDWNLGSSTYPQKWIFTLADNDVLVEARPFAHYHAKYPYAVQEYEQDGYALVPRSMLEIADPLNDTLTWLFNSHFHAVRKVLNDQLVVDPSKVAMKDLEDPTQGRLIRLKPQAWGTDPRLAVHQLQVVDVTQNHLRDAQIVAEMMQRVTGVTDNLMGVVNPGGRKTATEVRTSSSFGTNRLKMQAEYDSAMGWAPLSQMMLQNTQQYYDEEQWFKIAGDLVEGKQYVQVTPDDIQGFYDFVPVDGTLPVDRFAQANLWRELMAQMSKMPELMQQYSMGKIFSYVAKLSGAKNIDQFKIEVVPDAMAAQQAQAGNLIPMGGRNGNGRGTVGGEGESARPPLPTQISGVGPSG